VFMLCQVGPGLS